MSDQPATERTGRVWVWPAIVVVLLVMQIVISGAAFVIATSDPAFAVEEDYHDKALNWDDTVAAREASAALGWKAAVRVGEIDASGQRAVVVTLTDANAAPLAGAEVELIAFHHARAAEKLRAKLTPISGGIYAAKLAMPRDGWYEFRLVARRGESQFATIVKQNIGEVESP